MNVGGSSKMPSSPNGATHLSDRFFDHRDVSFVGRPFPLEEADEHFSRLRFWGFTFLRFTVTWEAIEHAGPGLYDAAYLDYLEQIVGRANDFGLALHIDPHQDAWSRFTGGDGAPGWTLEAVGMDLTRMHETGAAILQQFHGDPFPRMVWPTNVAKLGAATMFTFFFAGDDFAPDAKIDGEPVQEYLQRHYCDAMALAAARLRNRPNVLGYDTMNEPSHGFIGHQDLSRFEGPITMGDSPSPYQSMLLGAGFAQHVSVYQMRLTGPTRTGHRVINPNGVRLWRDGADCIWRRHGVWDIGSDGTPRLLRPGYFAAVKGRRVDFGQDYYRPFANRYAKAIRAARPAAVIFIQTEVGRTPPCWGAGDAARIVYAPHWYDPVTIVLKRYYRLIAYNAHTKRLVVGPHAIRRNVIMQMEEFRGQAGANMNDAPVVLGETGVPFDLGNRGTCRTGNFRARIAAVDRTMTGIESTLLSSCWWHYAADNDNAHGDQWNGEDFSVWSRDQQHDPADPNSGGRALKALVRPDARAVAGEPLQMRFRPRSGRFTFTFRHDATVTAPTELYIPGYHYPRGCRVSVSDGGWEIDAERQIMTYRHAADRGEHTITITRKKR
jgi:hypothetical protein